MHRLSFMAYLRPIACAMLIFFGATSPAAATDFPAYGGQGDAAFEDQCPAHQFLIGFAGMAGLWINRIRIICSPITPGGTHGQRWYGPLHGSSGETGVEFYCPVDSVVYAATIYLTGLKHAKVAAVNLSCGSMQADRQSTVLFSGGNGNGGFPRNQRCPAGELAFGLNGHYGTDVNALGLECFVITRS